MRVGLLKMAFASGLFLASFSNGYAADCEFWPIVLVPHGTAESRFTVKAGKTCTISFGGTGGIVTETRIIQKPVAGKAMVDGTRVIYEAKQGFAGNDEFTYSREGFDRTGQPAPMAVHLKVEVVP